MEADPGSGAAPNRCLALDADRIGLAALAADAVVICATSRLARDLRREHDRLQVARGLMRWPSLSTPTLAQWLDARLDEALLAGRIGAGAPRLALGIMQERILWDRAIEACSSGAVEEALFDRAGMANAALEANALMVTWNIRIPPGEQSEETRQFLRWQAEFRRICAISGWLEGARHLDWQLDALAAGAVAEARLPRQLVFAGFDRYNPQEQRFARILQAQGVAVYELEQGLARQGSVTVHALPDRVAECRAAAAWARRQLEARPEARLGIVVPELGALRETLAAILDDELDPLAVSPAHAEMPRRYNFTLGLPLARQPLVDTALRLLALLARPHRVTQETFGALLREPGWSAGCGEADARARLDFRMRERLAPTLSLERLLGFIRQEVERGLRLPRLLEHLEAGLAQRASLSARQVPSAWEQALARLLAALGWPGERPLSSHEYQARRAFDEALAALGELDVVLGRIDFAEAQRHLAQLCRERIFQAKTEGEPPLQVMGLLEAAGTPLDALWVMGMNDHLWPPSPRPNPLLPAELQRRARAPNASADVQGEFAATIQRRLLRSAEQVVFSHALSEGGRELRASPLLTSCRQPAEPLPADALAPGLLEALAALAGEDVALERLDDHLAPPVGADEVLRGGTALLRAQAICPAWAFYRYRLGARALEVAEEGLDERNRGTLLHAVLQAYWQMHGAAGSAGLLAMSAEQRTAAIGAAVDAGMAAFCAELGDELPARFAALERERLQRLVGLWLDVEAQRPQAFTVEACEEKSELRIEGIAATLVVDRIDRLDDGRRVVIDYKTGGKVSAATWGEARIREPQLPIYAALREPAATDDIGAVAFGRVRADGCGFVGIGAEAGILPEVAGIADDAARKQFPEQRNWPELLDHWRTAIAAIAREIQAGEAAVSFADEKDLEYCEVLPLLRLAERKAQMEFATPPVPPLSGGALAGSEAEREVPAAPSPEKGWAGERRTDAQDGREAAPSPDKGRAGEGLSGHHSSETRP